MWTVDMAVIPKKISPLCRLLEGWDKANIVYFRTNILDKGVRAECLQANTYRNTVFKCLTASCTIDNNVYI
jgi:hypothetical protein